MPKHPNQQVDTSRRVRVIAALTGLVALGVVLFIEPALLLAIPAFAFMFMPIYLPFLLSFRLKSDKWRGLKWALRIGCVLALLTTCFGFAAKPDFADDFGGNARGALHNLAWAWGSGVALSLTALLVGYALRSRSRGRKSNIGSSQKNETTVA
jgi:hypothetical protein